ncbi:hypothetical protein [Helicobacter sp.]|uniref:hypothetical protein n=1 Tax=Helicobacter sp. TaxID=218 RepID=UPI0025C051C9|nr:hypothetical protein [Helicobacter sp.]MCI5633765.1 hypothetical protein [Helicobacter sp.]
MTALEKQEKLDYAYIAELKTKSEKELRKMLDSIEEEQTELIKKGHFIKDALMEKWRTPSEELLEAIEEVKRGETYKCSSGQEMLAIVRNNNE